jgi:hypothetical protein
MLGSGSTGYLGYRDGATPAGSTYSPPTGRGGRGTAGDRRSAQVPVRAYLARLRLDPMRYRVDTAASEAMESVA